MHWKFDELLKTCVNKKISAHEKYYQNMVTFCCLLQNNGFSYPKICDTRKVLRKGSKIILLFVSIWAWFKSFQSIVLVFRATGLNLKKSSDVSHRGKQHNPWSVVRYKKAQTFRFQFRKNLLYVWKKWFFHILKWKLRKLRTAKIAKFFWLKKKICCTFWQEAN